MIQEMDSQKPKRIESLKPALAQKLGRSEEDIAPFIKILQQNWYETIDSLRTLKEQDYERMKIPLRVAIAIQEEIGVEKVPEVSKKDKQIVETTIKNQKNSLNETEMMALCGCLNEYLVKPENMKQLQARQIIQLLLKIIRNIIKDPYEMKYRKLKKSNKILEKNLFGDKMIEHFLKKIGFEDAQETFEMNNFDVPHLIFLEDCLVAVLNNLSKSLSKNEKFYIDFSKVPKMQGQNNPTVVEKKKESINMGPQDVKGYFNEQKLSEMKYSDALDKLMDIRYMIMSKPPKDRQLRIYHKKYETKNIRFNQVTFEEQFSKSEDSTIANYWKQIIVNNRKGANFQSKRKIEFEQLIKQKIYKQTLIKIKLPNELIVQAVFGPLETLQDVFNLVCKIAIGEIYMFTTPPVKKMSNKQFSMTLFDLDAVPMGIFYLGSNSQWCIDRDYHSIIQK